MASYEGKQRNSNGYLYTRSKPWRAARRREGRTIFIGYYATRAEAEGAEREFDKGWPPGIDAWGNNVWVANGRKSGEVRRQRAREKVNA
jgi:hypothetical protein